MHRLHLHRKALSGLIGQPGKERRQIVSRQPIQGAPQAVVVDILCHDAWTKQALDGFVREKLGHQVQAPMLQTEPVQDHR